MQFEVIRVDVSLDGFHQVHQVSAKHTAIIAIPTCNYIETILSQAFILSNFLFFC